MFDFFRSIRRSMVLLAVVLVVIVLHYLSILQPLEGAIIRIFLPIQQRVYYVGMAVNNLYSSFSTNGGLVKENSQLKNDVNRLTIENSQLKTLFADTQEIQIQQNFISSHGLQAITAHIIGKNPEPNLQAVILDKGSDDGISVDQPLIAADGIMVGKIYLVKTHSSEAMLINDSRSRIAALVQNQSNSKGVVVGEHGLSLRIELIPQNEPLHEGDVVITSGNEPTIPRGLVIGTLTKIDNEPNSFFQTALVQSLIRIDNLTIVSILKNPNL